MQHDHAGEKAPEKLSLSELQSLRLIRGGANVGSILRAHRDRFLRLGWIEQKNGGAVLTAYGRYQLEVRTREACLPHLAVRYRNRAEELRTIADTMTTGNGNTLHKLAAQWERLADDLAALERLELAEGWLG